MTAPSLLKILSLPRVPWASGGDAKEKIEMSVAEVESLRSEIEDAEEREAYLKGKLEHVDEVLKSARLAGYLYLRTRWTALPGEPPIIDDADIDDWLPRFVVLHGSCIFFYLQSTDLSPQDTTMLSDIVEVDVLPSVTLKNQQKRYAFYILTCQGLQFECSSISKVQVDSWMMILHSNCNLRPQAAANGVLH